MKRYFVAAGALLMSTSTLAFAADIDPIDKTSFQSDGVEVTKASDAHAGKTWNKSLAAADKAALASSDGFDDHAQAKLAAAATDSAEAELAMAPTGEWTDKGILDETASAKLQTASHDSAAAEAVAMSDKTSTQTAMGGPIEEGAMTTASLAPRPATTNYEPCEPGPGDDRCIQLYEPGVRAQLASWNAPTGGLADHSATTAMGGPYEPVQDHADASAAAGMGASHDSTMSKDEAAASWSGDTGQTEIAVHDSSAYQGVGGPAEAQSGYPPCEPGPGDDRCIQLYERGVTGAGN